MDDIQLKFNSLDLASRQVVMDFIDRLITRNKQAPKNNEDYKNKILSISQWSDEDLAPIEEAMKSYNFKPEEW